jgi:hypothetical protein
MSPDCELLHICWAYPLLSSHRWGFQGPSHRRRRDTTFRARRRNFSRSRLPCPILPTGDGAANRCPVAFPDCAASSFHGHPLVLLRCGTSDQYRYSTRPKPNGTTPALQGTRTPSARAKSGVDGRRVLFPPLRSAPANLCRRTSVSNSYRRPTSAHFLRGARLVISIRRNVCLRNFGPASPVKRIVVQQA